MSTWKLSECSIKYIPLLTLLLGLKYAVNHLRPRAFILLRRPQLSSADRHVNALHSLEMKLIVSAGPLESILVCVIAACCFDMLKKVSE